MSAQGCDPCCTIEELDQSTIVDKLLSVESLAVPNAKSTDFFDNLKCLWIDSNNTNPLRLKGWSTQSNDENLYIAVSYSWEPTPSTESCQTGGYRIVDTQGGSPRSNQVRDEILRRVISYAQWHKIHRIWIDQECTIQHEESEKQIAMDSMDLVYRESNLSLGLLAVILETQEEVNSLQNLLMGCMVNVTDSGSLRLVHPADDPLSLSVYRILRRLYEDRWWTRAWIFQEEHLSSTKMVLLIRRKCGLKARHTFGFSQDEICVNAADFRKEASLFLLALRPKISPKQSQWCTRMLERFGKYNVQYHFQHNDKRKAMAPQIFADIARRQLQQPFDRLPITANCCDYAVRLESQKMHNQGHSPGFCLLALYLLNGEILRNTREIKEPPTEMGVGDYVQCIAFNKFDPPVKTRYLSYLKGCRLHNVSFCVEGRQTDGQLWKIVDPSFTLTNLDLPNIPPKCHKGGLNNYQRSRLYQLSNKLESTFGDLSRDILNYLDQDRCFRNPSAAKEHMDLMAETVVEAIKTRKPLHIARAQDFSGAWGIFVGLADTTLHVFTSWRAHRDVDHRHRETHVSLGVEMQESEAGPLLRTVQWVNGLVFFQQRNNTSVIFEWPQVWMQALPQIRPIS
nr:hypothetical protein CFP56_58246 [Quercus suber]